MISVTSIVFYVIQFYDKASAYQYAITVLILLAGMLLEIPTTQQRFITIIWKAIKFIFIKKEYYLDSRKKEGHGVY